MQREVIPCKDGTNTFYNAQVGECYHSPVGAALESREKFAGACELLLRAKSGGVRILDVCYGLGYNSAAAIELIRKSNVLCRVEVVGLENDKSIVNDRMQLQFPFAHQEVFDALSANYDEQTGEFSYHDETLDIRVMIADARKSVKQLTKNSFDVIFFDPFSLGKQAEMWTQEFINDVYAVCADKGVLVTYSCARLVRERLRIAGFEVADGPVVGRRGPATIASKSLLKQQ